MFSSNNNKLLNLQNEYIDRINRNALKLNKQLQFFMNLQHQIGGAGAVTKNPEISPIEKMQFDQLYAETLAVETTNKLQQLQERVDAIRPTLQELEERSGNFLKILGGLGDQITNIDPGQLKSYTDKELKEMKKKIPDSISKVESTGAKRTDPNYIDELIAELLNTEVEPKPVKSEQDTENKYSGATGAKGAKVAEVQNKVEVTPKTDKVEKKGSESSETKKSRRKDLEKNLDKELEKDNFQGLVSYDIMKKALQGAGKITDGDSGSFKNKKRDLQRYDEWAKKPVNRSYKQGSTQMTDLKTYYQDLTNLN